MQLVMALLGLHRLDLCLCQYRHLHAQAFKPSTPGESLTSWPRPHGSRCGRRSASSGLAPAAQAVGSCTWSRPCPASGQGSAITLAPAPPAQAMPPAIGHRSAAPGQGLTGWPILYGSTSARCLQLRPCHRPPVSGHQPSVSRAAATNHQPSAIGHRPSAIGHRPSISGQRSAVSGQPSGQQFRPCHRPALRSCHQPATSRSRRRPHEPAKTGLTRSARCQQRRPCHRSAGQPPCLRQQRKPCHRPALRPAAGDGGQVLPSASRSRRRPHGSRSVRCQQLSRLPVKQSAGWTSRQLRRSSNQPAGQVSSSGQPIGQRSAAPGKDLAGWPRPHGSKSAQCQQRRPCHRSAGQVLP